MPHSVVRAATALATVALIVLAVSACGAGKTVATAADYNGLWVNPDQTNRGVTWLRVSAHGDTVTLSWEHEGEAPVAQQATLQGDGTLTAAIVPALDGFCDMSQNDYTGRLTPDGNLDMSVTAADRGTTWTDTLHFERGSQEQYAAFAARTNTDLKQQALADDFGQALTTLGQGIRQWAAKHGGKAPPAHEVRPGGAVEKELLADGTPWPGLSNGKLLLPGHGRGQFVYRPLAHGYRLNGIATDGTQVGTSGTW